MGFLFNPLAGVLLVFAGANEASTGEVLEGAHCLAVGTAAAGLVVVAAAGALALVAGPIFLIKPFADLMLDFAGPKETGVAKDLAGAH